MNDRRHKSPTGVQASGHTVEMGRNMWRGAKATRRRMVEMEDGERGSRSAMEKNQVLEQQHQSGSSSA